jgi:hypothetical protein
VVGVDWFDEEGAVSFPPTCYHLHDIMRNIYHHRLRLMAHRATFVRSQFEGASHSERVGPVIGNDLSERKYFPGGNHRTVDSITGPTRSL